ncbi:hypothetical protein FVR03_10160 [Pontibacter qinzhouensis]|uniref:Oligosaccharide repeat unit polymerase n=1 Tax=Pontibacter qinzhouensis TaxID=2603253 RepID=A0A5C8KAZ7_9BACT|nr:hypothetical protein [Pontibacter qinzhouensis]TXK46974.1 hypothetical protein FVR03_10160 [Pontibacter qinzhouensis]
MALSLWFITLINLLEELDREIAIRGLIAFMYAFQLLLGPILSFKYLPNWDYYSIPVTEDEYFSFAIPAIIALIIGLYFPLFKGKFSFGLLSATKTYLADKEKVALILIGIGLVSSYLVKIVPGGLAFFFFLLKNLKFIGVFYLFYSKSNKKTTLFILVFGLLAINAITSSMFHDLILWTMFVGMLFTLTKKIPFFIKLSAAAAGFFVLFLVQSVKGEYRNALWFGSIPSGQETEYFQSLIEERISDMTTLFSDKSINGFIYRINQGWIVGNVLYNVPTWEPYANGETIVDGISASILPRFLNPDKYVAGGKEYFTRFSGLVLSSGTSMNISPLGEAYANFGSSGGALFMFAFGMIFNFILASIYKFSKFYPSLILWLPLIFLQVVKAETDFTTVFNHLVKACFITWILYKSFPRFLKLKL